MAEFLTCTASAAEAMSFPNDYSAFRGHFCCNKWMPSFTEGDRQ